MTIWFPTGDGSTAVDAASVVRIEALDVQDPKRERVMRRAGMISYPVFAIRLTTDDGRLHWWFGEDTDGTPLAYSASIKLVLMRGDLLADRVAAATGDDLVPRDLTWTAKRARFGTWC